MGCCIEGSLSGLRVFCQEEVHLHNQHTTSQQRWENRLYERVQSCPALCDPMDGSPPGSPVYGISQVRMLERVAISPFRGSFRPRDQTCISCVSYTAGRFFTTEPLGKPIYNSLHLLITNSHSLSLSSFPLTNTSLFSICGHL